MYETELKAVVDKCDAISYSIDPYDYDLINTYIPFIMIVCRPKYYLDEHHLLVLISCYFHIHA